MRSSAAEDAVVKQLEGALLLGGGQQRRQQQPLQDQQGVKSGATSSGSRYSDAFEEEALSGGGAGAANDRPASGSSGGGSASAAVGLRADREEAAGLETPPGRKSSGGHPERQGAHVGSAQGLPGGEGGGAEGAGGRVQQDARDAGGGERDGHVSMTFAPSTSSRGGGGQAEVRKTQEDSERDAGSAAAQAMVGADVGSPPDAPGGSDPRRRAAAAGDVRRAPRPAPSPSDGPFRHFVLSMELRSFQVRIWDQLRSSEVIKANLPPPPSIRRCFHRRRGSSCP